MVNLREWSLPAVAAWTRDRASLQRAVADTELRVQAERLARSDAGWLRTLLGVQLDATWLVLCPLQARGFWVVLDGLVSNHDLHALLAHALTARGIPGVSNPDDVIAFLQGRDVAPTQDHVAGTWNLYDAHAAGYDLSQGRAIPTERWVWGEGIPNDVPPVDGTRVLLIGPPSIVRSWSLNRVFAALPSALNVRAELTPAEYDHWMTRLRARSHPDA